MLDAERLEIACADAWPALVDRPLGQWRLRAADGFTGRANSVLAVGDPGRPVPAALAAGCEFAHAHGIPPMAQAVVGGPVEAALSAAGWVPHVEHPAGHEVSVLVGPLVRGDKGTARVLTAPIGPWWELVAGGAAPSRAQRHVLAPPGTGFGVVTEGRATVGAVRATPTGELLHLARLAVRPEHRRRGLATALVHAAGGWALERGATRGVLQVAVGNTAALSLYRGLGYVEHHRYRYWVPGPNVATAWKDSAV
ncbi:Ribosomal protein S18 acetylase RimI [Amycolatopsis arida]|uniref:Ribosomal protein S18 acetylase RimI n=1 Tax=Amycolatopsis arida TaxID=587909 RepID=A0A1I5WJC4_9PSEU|nr:GNAT family N-acetyltransferase [Amycolatopsis arida]TDX92313.1 ribosomal protein S18 acetylase RimI-like enzyme [Amycolatopsis arida]SFQ19799.1 Ribosomal protein S18 acetylase RimI [Amycolatopsis arida]